jgi:hypothetical protein
MQVYVAGRRLNSAGHGAARAAYVLACSAASVVWLVVTGHLLLLLQQLVPFMLLWWSMRRLYVIRFGVS